MNSEVNKLLLAPWNKMVTDYMHKYTSQPSDRSVDVA